MKPGGHGVIWKLMIDEGVFAWLEEQGRAAALVRQISNPLAGTDTTLLALAGEGYPRRRAFGFASCDRVVGASEGVNVLARTRLRRADDGSSSSSGSGDDSGGDRYSLRITNLEYTEFGRLGIADCSVDEDSEHSVFPANTNVLYVGLEVRRGLSSSPGMFHFRGRLAGQSWSSRGSAVP